MSKSTQFQRGFTHFNKVDLLRLNEFTSTTSKVNTNQSHLSLPEMVDDNAFLQLPCTSH